MRISDGSSDVCSSDLGAVCFAHPPAHPHGLAPGPLDAGIDHRHGLVGAVGGHRADLEALAAVLRQQRQEALHHGVLEHREEGFLVRSEEHTSELQSLMRISYAVFCLKKKTKYETATSHAALRL